MEIFGTGDVQFYEISEYVFAFSRYKIYWMENHDVPIIGIILILIFRSNYFIVINLRSELENINLKKFKKRPSSFICQKISFDIINT